LNDPDVVLEYTHDATAGFVYGQYLKLTKSPVGAAADADPANASAATPTTAVANSDRTDFLMRLLLGQWTGGPRGSQFAK
jgi:hypothetical protein